MSCCHATLIGFSSVCAWEYEDYSAMASNFRKGSSNSSIVARPPLSPNNDALVKTRRNYIHIPATEAKFPVTEGNEEEIAKAGAKRRPFSSVASDTQFSLPGMNYAFLHNMTTKFTECS